MSQKDPTYIKIDPDGIECACRAYYKESVSDPGYYNWFIPGFNIRFNSKSIEDGEKRASKMMNFFINHWIKNGTFRDFILEIHRLGFKANQNHELTVSKLLKKQITTAKFKPLTLESLYNKGYQNKDLLVKQPA